MTSSEALFGACPLTGADEALHAAERTVGRLSRWCLFSLLVGLLLADQVTKIALSNTLLFDPGAGSQPDWLSRWATTQVGAVAVAAGGVAAAAVSIWLVWCSRTRLSGLAAVFVGAGVLGNLLSRLGLSALSGDMRLGVPNLFSLPLPFGFCVGNLADICQVLGVVLVGAHLIRTAWRFRRLAPRPPVHALVIVGVVAVIAGGWSAAWWTNRQAAAMRSGSIPPHTAAQEMNLLLGSAASAQAVLANSASVALTPSQASQVVTHWARSGDATLAGEAVNLYGSASPASIPPALMSYHVAEQVSSPPRWLIDAWIASGTFQPSALSQLGWNDLAERTLWECDFVSPGHVAHVQACTWAVQELSQAR